METAALVTPEDIVSARTCVEYAMRQVQMILDGASSPHRAIDCAGRAKDGLESALVYLAGPTVADE